MQPQVVMALSVLQEKDIFELMSNHISSSMCKEET